MFLYAFDRTTTPAKLSCDPCDLQSCQLMSSSYFVEITMTCMYKMYIRGTHFSKRSKTIIHFRRIAYLVACQIIIPTTAPTTSRIPKRQHIFLLDAFFKRKYTVFYFIQSVATGSLFKGLMHRNVA